MDASYYSNTLTQYQMNHVIRELNKAYSGFYSNKDSPIDIATGNWGCGAFNGNHYFKGLWGKVKMGCIRWIEAVIQNFSSMEIC